VKDEQFHVVTGAFGYTGKYITRRLIATGKPVRTLTGHPNRHNPFGEQVDVAPLAFDDPDELVRSLRGAATLFNTYWVRFPHGQVTFDKAVENTKTLIKAACDAAVRRIVHLSITSASGESHLPYFKGKGLVETAIMASGLSYAIIRPAVIFGDGGILINNIAWLLRHLPVFVVPGRGDYRLQPVFVEDLAELAVQLADKHENTITDAIGPEVLTFDECVRLIADTVHRRARIIHLRPWLAHLLSRPIGHLVDDVMLTRDEMDGLMGNLLVSDGPPTAPTRLSDWLSEHADSVGSQYISELKRHYR